jgi:hypothetical protein
MPPDVMHALVVFRVVVVPPLLLSLFLSAATKKLKPLFFSPVHQSLQVWSFL